MSEPKTDEYGNVIKDEPSLTPEQAQKIKEQLQRLNPSDLNKSFDIGNKPELKKNIKLQYMNMELSSSWFFSFWALYADGTWNIDNAVIGVNGKPRDAHFIDSIQDLIRNEVLKATGKEVMTIKIISMHNFGAV
jgi:hypothetical protein